MQKFGKSMCFLLILIGFVLGDPVTLGKNRTSNFSHLFIPTSKARGSIYTEGEPWLEGWAYRKSHIIQGSSTGSVTNYPMQFTVHYGSGEDDGKDVYLNEHCRTDFGDLRFTQSDGQTNVLHQIHYRPNSRFWSLLLGEQQGLLTKSLSNPCELGGADRLVEGHSVR